MQKRSRREKDIDLNAVIGVLARVLSVDAARIDDDPRGAKLATLARNMAADGHRRDDPVREIFVRLGDKWSMLLLLLLQAGPFRHSALRRLAGTMGADETISQRMLTLRLRTLERDGLIVRHRSPGRVPHVEYSLTDLGAGLLVEAERIFVWARRRKADILAARAAFASADGNG